MEIMSIEETHKLLGGIEEFIDKVNSIEKDEISCLVERLVADEELGCSVEIVSGTCRIYRYYTEETAVAVQTHFTRSLEETLDNMSSKGTNTESDIPVKKTTARSRRKPKRQPVTTSSSYNPMLSTAVLNHPYARPPTKQQTTFLVPPRVFEPHHYHHQAVHHGIHYGIPQPCEFNIKSEYSREREQSPYKAFSNGKTLIEVYSPTVGRGFNPRYNSLLIEPTIQPHLPLIAGQSPVNPPTDIQTFLHLAVEVNIPNSHDVRIYGN